MERLCQKFGKDKVFSGDVKQTSENNGRFVFCDISDCQLLEKIVTENNIKWIFNMAAILSMGCELDHLLAFKVNVQGFQNVMEMARLYSVRITHASSIGTFGPSTPMQMTPDVSIQRPPMLYGCTKVYAKLLGEYYHRKWGVDFRSLRYPVIIADSGRDLKNLKTSIVGSAPLMFQEAAKGGHCILDIADYSCMPYIHIEDCVEGTIKLMEAKNENLTVRTYNIMAFSATMAELLEEINKIEPNFKVDFQPDPMKQPLVDALVDSVDDSNARKDWAWNPIYNKEKLVKEMIANHRQKIIANK